MNAELTNIIDEIEKGNNFNFTDPFYSQSFVLNRLYHEYLDNNKMCVEEGYYLNFIFHLEDLLINMERTSDIYLKRVKEYEKWRTNGFKKKLYIVLSSEAEDIADKIAECISKLDEAHHGLIDYPLFCDLQYSFINIIKHVQRTSKSLSVYHLENLW